MSPDQIPLGSYSHLNMAFGYIDSDTFTIAEMDDTVAAQYTAVTALKSKQPGLKVRILAISGRRLSRTDMDLDRGLVFQ